MSRRRRRNRLPPEPVEVTIESMNHDGKGVTHINGKAVFVTGALPHETVRIQYTKTKKSYDEAVCIDVIEKSDIRIDPLCEVFGVCGGCSLQHMESSEQIRYKQTALLEVLEHIGKVKPETVLDPLMSDSPWGYRRKARLGVKYVVKKDRVLVGFRERAGRFITETERCHVLHPVVGHLLTPLSELVYQTSIRDQIPQIEVAMDDQHCLLNFRILSSLTDDDRKLFEDFAKKHGITLYLQTGGPDSIRSLNGETLDLAYTLGDQELTFHFLPNDFTQVNFGLNQKMVNHALELLNPDPDDVILDLFCGLGNFTLPIAQRCREVVGVEGDPGLVERARMNARYNGVENTRYFVSNLYETLDQEPWMKEKFNRILLDPPRSGAQEIVSVIDRFQAETLVYVSCYPGTLARDAGILVHQQGYHLQAAGVMDMFPHTGHVESIALFTKKLH